MIESPNINKIYIGMTSIALEQRFSNHKRCARKHSTKYCSSQDIIRAKDATIRQIAFCQNKTIALRLETMYINKFYKGKCCNKLKNINNGDVIIRNN
jgi:predicted GIY-YIG superfamily endonuclease